MDPIITHPLSISIKKNLAEKWRSLAIFLLLRYNITSDLTIMKIVNINDPSSHDQALTVLQDGGLVICPTETVYGALVDATNQTAVAKLLTYKHRPIGKPFSVACANQEMAAQYVFLNQQADKIYQTLLPGPVTVISDNRGLVTPGVASEKNTLGIRIPAYPFLLRLVQDFARPVTATSANSSGKKAPYSIPDLLAHLSPKQQAQIDLILDAGVLPKNPPSIVIDTTTTSPTILRENKNVSFATSSTVSPEKKFPQKNSQPKATAKKTGREFCSHSDQETRLLAGKILAPYLSQLASTGLIIALDGPLGAGKTAFTQGLAQFLHISAHLTSPTYTYLKEYPYSLAEASGTLYHFDVWTIDNAATLKLLDIDQLARPHNLLVIEWYDQIRSFFTPTLPLLSVQIQETALANERHLIVSSLESPS